MIDVEKYYNEFYDELSWIDDDANSFSKIKFFLPELKVNAQIADIGCGHGGVSRELVARGFDVYGIEINDAAINSLKAHGFKVLKRNINLPLDIDIKFDVILILDVLEHLFNPYHLLNEAKKIIKNDGVVIVTVPLYFDLIDRFKILFTGSIISMDNLCYGQKNYRKFRSYNYDHIRFFRPMEILELGKILGFRLQKIEYVPTGYYGESKILKWIFKLAFNKFTVRFNPNLFAHSVKIRWSII
jgi:2-polyprenyl-3-methyl-5-hydroxy-6-metoxy-1,4-benzoquinol methylase